MDRGFAWQRRGVTPPSPVVVRLRYVTSEAARTRARPTVHNDNNNIIRRGGMLRIELCSSRFFFFFSNFNFSFSSPYVIVFSPSNRKSVSRAAAVHVAPRLSKTSARQQSAAVIFLFHYRYYCARRAFVFGSRAVSGDFSRPTPEFVRSNDTGPAGRVHHTLLLQSSTVLRVVRASPARGRNTRLCADYYLLILSVDGRTVTGGRRSGCAYTRPLTDGIRDRPPRV